MDPADVVAAALADIWQPPAPGDPDRFPSRPAQGTAVVDALRSAGFVVEPAERIVPLVRAARFRLRGCPPWSDDHDPLAASVVALFPSVDTMEQ
jgi:hypothetical protein